MQAYVGVKQIEARPLNLGDYNDYRGWTIPEDENPNREGYLVRYPDGYESWSPKEAFDKAYLPVGEDMADAFEGDKAAINNHLKFVMRWAIEGLT